MSAQKINFIPHFLLNDCKLVILGTFGTPGYCQKKLKYQPVENVDAFLHTKSKVIPHSFLEILQRYCKGVILGALNMPGHIHQKWLTLLKFNIIKTSIFISMQKIILISPNNWKKYFGKFRILSIRGKISFLYVTS